MDENDGIWVFSEVHELSLELLGKARQLADAIETNLSVISVGASSKTDDYFHHGADQVLSITNPILETFQVDTYVDALSSLANQKKPELILIGATRSGLELAPRLAERLKTGCVTEAISMEPDADKEFILMDRVSMGGTTIETHASRSKPQIVTVARGIFAPMHPDSSRTGEEIEVNPEIKSSTTKILHQKTIPNLTSLRSPSMVVCIGRGLKTKSDVTMIEKFAERLGADVAPTRSLAEDLKLLSAEKWLGFTGQRVGPNLCLTCGISGQPETVSGFSNSHIVISINSDPSARIFGFSDYAIIGDFHEIIPKLMKIIGHLD